jgi:predicted transposase YbfD/YdcC
MPALTGVLVEKLPTMADPRRQCAHLKPPLVDIILVGFCGVLGGCEDCVESAEWGKGHEAAVRTFLELPQGIPAQDTFNRVFALRKPTALQEVVLAWLLERRGLPGDWIHVDGKTRRQTGRAPRKLQAVPVVSAWAGQTGLTVGQVAGEAKAKEIPARPELLKLLDLHDTLVTTDAMGGPKDLAQTIVAGGGDSILAVKDHQPPLHAELQAAFATAPTPSARSARLAPTEAQGQGREEPRTGQVLPARGQLSAAQCALWLGVLTIGMVTRVVGGEATGKERIEGSYFLRSLPPQARRIGRAIRGHWGSENGLHWV